MKILVTGAAGRVGSAVVKGLKDRYSLRGFDRVPTPELEDAVVGDITDFNGVLIATQDMEAVIHLAGNPSSGAPWEGPAAPSTGASPASLPRATTWCSRAG